MNQSILDILLTLKKTPGKHDGHDNDDRSWCYECNCSDDEKEFTSVWMYNRAIDDVIEALTKAGVCVVPDQNTIKYIIRKEIQWLNHNVFSNTEIVKLHTATVLENYIEKSIRALLLGEDRKG